MLIGAACLLTLNTGTSCIMNPPDGTDPPPGQGVVEVTIDGNGRVTQSGNGSLVTLTAAPDNGWVFVDWSGADVPNENPLVVDADEIGAITAMFSPAPADTDNDGIIDDDDNCPMMSNADQADRDNDRVGDICDNCPDDANTSQVDTDQDSIADGCDNCPGQANTDQADEDGDGVGDVCEGDRDSDGIADDNDNCAQVANADQADTDLDGLGNACDNCPDEPNDDQADADNDQVGDICDACVEDPDNDKDQDGVCGDADRCPGTAPRANVDAFGCPLQQPPPPPPGSVCGNDVVETGEQCEPPNTAECDANCQTITPATPANDNCTDPTTVTDGRTPFSNANATTDGPDEPAACTFLGDSQFDYDVWFCYTAACDGEAVVSMCGSEYDTKMAVYDGCDCPTQEPLACNDDGCGASAVDSRLTFQATSGQSYMIRVGGFLGAEGNGTLTIRCGVETCGAAQAGACFEEHTTPGCDDAACCDTTCTADPYCCDVTWDSFCAGEAEGLCTGSFAACGAAGSGACSSDNDTPGCATTDCCNAVCLEDPFCCVDKWDSICAEKAAGICGLNCGGNSGSCFLANGSPGCAATSCCQTVCQEDPFCCLTDWDGDCAAMAAQQCR